MATALVALALAGCATAPSTTSPGVAGAEDAALAHARKLLRSTILVDGHNDLPYAIRGYKQAPGDVVAYDLRKPTPGHTDIARLRAGGLGAQFWSVYIPGEGRGPFARPQLEQIELARRIIDRYPDVLQLAQDVVRHVARHVADAAR
ncbi:MAG: hypothetical protein EBS39_13285, partial [Gammaproteobacteria bacterium]|nr:hypothetical protein [Gammaproteobacteria bacterium]